MNIIILRTFIISSLQLSILSSKILNPISNKSHLFLFNKNKYKNLKCSSSIMSTSKNSDDQCSNELLKTLNFDNRNILQLPVDNSRKMGSRIVPNAIFSLVTPTPVKNPRVMAVSTNALSLLGIPANYCIDDLFIAYFSGNEIIPGSNPAAHAYCGYQFGNFAGQLGDGATMYLGEVINPITNVRWELQFKGAGKTPFSRTADGRKVLRSSVREFLCSEAMFNLNIPTSRAATCITSDSTVERDPFYNGNVIDEQCAVITRIAENFFRFGSFEIFKTSQFSGDRAGPSAGQEELKKQLLDHILLYYPNLKESNPHYDSEASIYKMFFREISNRTALLVAKWQAVGFVHGVLNTDNMSIMGLTIDYGPFGFMEHYDPDFVPNGSDNSGRYSYKQQPSICKWNLERLANALFPLVTKPEAFEVLLTYDNVYQKHYNEIMSRKFGFIFDWSRYKQETIFMNEFFEVLAETGGDFTDSFIALTEFCEELHLFYINRATLPESKSKELFDDLVDKLVSRSASPSTFVSILERKLKIHKLSMRPNDIEQLWTMLQNNPAQLSEMFNGVDIAAIRGEIEGEKIKLDLIMKIIKDTEKYKNMSEEVKRKSDRESWLKWCKKYIQRLSVDEKDKSGDEIVELLQNRVVLMRQENPTFILRNWIAQDAISAAENETDYSLINTILKLSEDPFNPNYSSFKQIENNNITDPKEKKYLSKPPEWADR